MNKANEKISYESAIKELENIVKGIENKDVSVDELIEKVKRAVFLIKHCKEKLQTTDSEIKKVLEEIEKSDKGNNS